MYSKWAIGILAILLVAPAYTLAAAEEAGSAPGAEQTPEAARPFAENGPLVADASDEERAGLAEGYATTGRQSLAAGRLAEAAARLEASYRLSGNAEVLFELCEALERARRPAAAARLLQNLLRSPDLAPQLRYDVEVRFSQLEPRIGTLTVATTPAGVWLSLDDELLGRSPLSAPVLLEPGVYVITARSEGLRPEVQRFPIAEGQHYEMPLRLEPLSPREADPNWGLDVALWTLISLVAAGALASVVVSAVTVEYRDRLSQRIDLASTEVERHDSLRQASFGLLGATGGLIIATVTLGLVRARRSHTAEADRSE